MRPSLLCSLTAAAIIVTSSFTTLHAADDERAGLIRGKGGAPLTLVGPALVVGQPAPQATLRDAGLKPVTIAWNDGTVRIVTTAPSLDTPTCSKQAHAFGKRVNELGGKVEVIFVSRDLPFAQSRFCAAEGITGLRVLSDYVDGSFGRAWGLLVKEISLDARAAVVVDGAGVVRYQEIVADLPKEPDYDAVLASAVALVPK